MKRNRINGFKDGRSSIYLILALLLAMPWTCAADVFTVSPYAEEYVVVGLRSGQIYYIPHMGGGVFGEKSEVGNFSSNGKYAHTAICDFDLDSDLDFVASLGAGRIIYFENLGMGQFQDWEIYNDPARTHYSSDFAVGDFDVPKDGYCDLIFSGNDNVLLMFKNNSTVPGQQPVFTLEGELTVPEVGYLVGKDALDYDQDNITDFITTGYNYHDLLLFRGVGAFTFDDPVIIGTVPNQGFAVIGVVTGDFGQEDCEDVISGFDDDGDPGQSWLWWNADCDQIPFQYCCEAVDTNPEEDEGQNLPGGGHGDAYDFDKDGILDIVVTRGIGSGVPDPRGVELYYFKGLGNGTFEGAEEIATFPDIPRGVAAPLPMAAQQDYQPVCRIKPFNPNPRECIHGEITVALDATDSYDPEGNELSCLWEPLTTGIIIDDTESCATEATITGGTGSYTVRLTVDDGAQTSSCEDTVWVQDTTPPELICGEPIIAYADDQCLAYAQPTASAEDDCDPSPESEWRPAGPYALGTHPLFYFGVDETGNLDYCESEVAVLDVTPPDVTCGLEPIPVENDEDEDDDTDGYIDNLYEIFYEATDNCDAGPCCYAWLNDVEIGDGEVVALKFDDRYSYKLEVDEDMDMDGEPDGPPFMSFHGPQFLLEVSCSDVSGNFNDPLCESLLDMDVEDEGSDENSYSGTLLFTPSHIHRRSF